MPTSHDEFMQDLLPVLEKHNVGAAQMLYIKNNNAFNGVLECTGADAAEINFLNGAMDCVNKFLALLYGKFKEGGETRFFNTKNKKR